MGACCSEFDGESYEEDFSSDESSDEGTPTKHLPGVAKNLNRDQPPMLVTDVTKVIWTTPRPMLVVKPVKAHPVSLGSSVENSYIKDAVPCGGVEMQNPSDLPRLGLRGPLNPEPAAKTAEKTVAMEDGLKTTKSQHRRGLSSANVQGGCSVAAPPGQNQESKDGRKTRRSKHREDEAYAAYLEALIDEAIGDVWFPEDQQIKDDVRRRGWTVATYLQGYEQHVWTGSRAMSEFGAIKAGGPRGLGDVDRRRALTAARGSRS